MDYKQKYSAIPEGYKDEVLKEAGGIPRIAITRYFKSGNPKYHTSDNRKAIIELAIDKICKPHNLAKDMSVTMLSKVIADHLLGTDFIDYSDLMTFKLQGCEDIADTDQLYEVMKNAKASIEYENNNNPYGIKLLIAKKIIHDARNNY